MEIQISSNNEISVTIKKLGKISLKDVTENQLKEIREHIGWIEEHLVDSLHKSPWTREELIELLNESTRQQKDFVKALMIFQKKSGRGAKTGELIDKSQKRQVVAGYMSGWTRRINKRFGAANEKAPFIHTEWIDHEYTNKYEIDKHCLPIVEEYFSK